MTEVGRRRERVRRLVRLGGAAGPAALRSALRWSLRHVAGFYAAAGLFLAGGLALALLGLWGLSELADSVADGETLAADVAVLRWMDANASAWLDDAALRVTALGETLVVATITAVAASLLWLLGRRWLAATVLLSVLGGLVIHPALKLAFDRPRPRVFEWGAHAVGMSSFPSGHATMAVVLFVALAFVVDRLAPRRWMRVAAVAAAATVAVLVGWSRLYLGVHYPSDVAAGYAVGFAWTIFCALGVETIRRARGRSRSPPAPPAEP